MKLPTPRLPIAWISVLALVACADEPGPTAPDGATDPTTVESPAQATSANAVFDDRVRLLPASEFDLVSTPGEAAAGRFAFVSSTGTFPEVGRDDFIVAEVGGQPLLRRVVESRVEDGALTLETGHAWWHEVVHDGTVSLNIPFDGSGPPTLEATGPARVPVTATSAGRPLPEVSVAFDEPFDVCAGIQTIVDLLGGEQVCGNPVDVEYGAQVTLRVAGTLDSLRIESGDLRVRGDMDLSMTVESGGISGGTPPVFSPCNRANYTGCVQTPTGAALVDWLRRYAPAIPDGSLAPVRLCVPGTPVRVARGYWQGLRWIPPRFEKCRIASIGTLPTVTPPSLQNVDSEIRPRVTGEIVIRAIGDGEFELKIGIPSASASAAYSVTNDFYAKASVGVFVIFRATIKNGGGTVRFTLDDTGRITQTWTDQAGWEGDAEVTDKNRSAQLLDLTAPDSVVFRVGVPVEAQAEICVAIVSCDEQKKEGGDSTFAAVAASPSEPEVGTPAHAVLSDPGDFELRPANGILSGLNIGAKVGAGLSMFYEFTWSREQVHPTDVDVDNWHIALDQAYDFTAKAGITIPFQNFLLPDVPLSFDETWECCRTRMADYWGQARLQVTTATTGSDPDPDGYTVTVERTDSLPDFVAEGATRLIPWSDYEDLLTSLPVDVVGSVIFGQGVSALPCNALYSDYAVAVAGGITAYAVVNGLRALGVGIPNYALTTPCPFLIAPYRVELAGVAENCTVTGGAVRDDVWLQQRDLLSGRSNTKELHFDVVCTSAADLGALRVVMDPDAAGDGERPHVLLDGVDQGPVPPNDTLVVPGLRAGPGREVGFDLVSDFCTTQPVTVEVIAGDTVTAAPAVSCVVPPPSPTDAVHFEASVVGATPDADGYELRVDGLSVAAMAVDRRTSVEGVPAGERRAYLVGGIDPRCVPLEANPRAIALDASGNAVTVPFPVRCYDQPVDTLTGTVEGTGGSAARLRLSDGTDRLVNGPRTSELARMTGSTVRAWGSASATGFRVHGYELRRVAGDERWMGILLDRPDGTWLMGTEVWRVVNPPDALRASHGSLVWIKGSEVGGEIETTLFGVIREGS